MSRTLLTNIGQLVTNDPTHDGTPLGLINDAALLIEDEQITWVGSQADVPVRDVEQQVDVQGQALIPGFVDSHNHLVFAGDRSFEFAERMQGRKYAAGGINYTVEQTRAATAHHVQSRLHICHLTTRGGVELVRWAKSQGMSVTAEVTPHHLLLTDDLAESYDSVYKVNPPLRTQDDVQALRDGLADGTIDIVATDHAPHAAEAKECEWNTAAFGMLGLETALSVVVEAMVSTKKMDWVQLVDRMSTAPARIAGYEGHGAIRVGAPAHLTVIDLDATWRVDRSALASKSSNTPFHGMSLPATVLQTYFHGVQVVNNGEVTGLRYE